MLSSVMLFHKKYLNAVAQVLHYSARLITVNLQSVSFGVGIAWYH